MKPIRINKVADDCTSVTFDKLDCHIQEGEVTILLDNEDAEGLINGLWMTMHLDGLAEQQGAWDYKREGEL